jgi:toxin ParE1/3/4
VKVVWTLGAVSSLRAIRNYIQQDNPDAAKKIADRLEQMVAKLKDYPNIGRPGIREGTRELVAPNLPFIIIYRVMNQEVQILRIFHTKQNRPH